MPHGGLALSNALATIGEMGLLLYLLRLRLGGMEGRRMLASLARIGLASLAMGAVALAIAWLLKDQSAWLLAGVAVVSGLVVYAALSLALGSPEPRAVWQMVTRRRRPPAEAGP
jgi:putative peptidoglycan lipid II flippase